MWQRGWRKQERDRSEEIEAPVRGGARLRELHPERRVLDKGRVVVSDHHGSQYGRKIYVHPPDWHVRADGASRVLRSLRESHHRHPRRHLCPCRRWRLPAARRLHLHGRNARDGIHPQGRHGQIPRYHRRARPGNFHVGRHGPGVGHQRAPYGKDWGGDPVRDPLPRDHGAPGQRWREELARQVDHRRGSRRAHDALPGPRGVLRRVARNPRGRVCPLPPEDHRRRQGQGP
mmetsp:Transcript_8198/g.22243  ORF Transcript_8198/g.22243 Transcript_8198/m.22243 type:complete len:231 (-) Transcript_8198:1834-2526(-)